MSNEYEQPVEPMSRTEDLLRTGTEEPVIAMSEIEKILRGEHIDRPHSRVADLLLQYNPSDILIEKRIEENGTYYATADAADGYYKVVVDTPVIPPTVLEHLVETVSTNGTHTFTPGTGVDGFSDASITVSVAPNVGSKNITQNGNYTASSDNLDGYSNVNVNVTPNVGSKNIIENGTYNALSDNLDGYSQVVVDVDPPQNSYAIATATTSISDAERLPVASAVVSVTDKDKAELFLTTDGVVSEDNTPYTYRPSPSGKSYVDLSVVGGTVVWNQLVQNGNFADDSKWSTYLMSVATSNNELTATVTTAHGTQGNNIVYNTSSNTIVGHKYYFSCDLYVPTTNSTLTAVKCGLRGTNLIPTTQTNVWQNISGISTVSSSNNIFVVASSSSTTVGDYFKVRKVFVTDLTQAFGSTIADYIYSLEQATAGSGIAWLKSYGFLTKSYYAYNAGTLMSVNASSHDTVGFNQWDEEWELGTYDNTTGAKVDASNRIRSKNYIKCVPNTNYYAKLWQGATFSIRMFYYDANYNFISSPDFIQQGVFTTPNNAYYMTFILAATYGTTYNHDICINVSDTSKNGTYEPYIKHTYPLDSDLTLRGIPKLDANNNIYYDGDVYSADGSVTRRYGVVDLGTLSWGGASNGRVYSASASLPDIKPITASATVSNIICFNYTTVSARAVYDKTSDGSICVAGAGYGGDKSIGVYDSSLANKSALEVAQAMSGVYLVYELATPTSETADAFATPQLVGSTEEFIDTRDVPMPVGQNSKYVNGNIYIKYLDSVTTGDIELADENAIIPLENTTYISSNGSASIDYWKYVVTHMSTKNINANGTYEAPIGEAYNKLIVNLPDGTNTEY